MPPSSSRFDAVFFDFGSTLIYSKAAWPPIYARSDRALVEALRRSGLAVEPDAFTSEFASFLDIYYNRRGTSTVEHTATAILRELLEQKGFRDVPGTTLRAALDALYSVTQQNWYLEEDALPTLQSLRQAGYRLGMISNTSDDENVQQLLDRWELRPYFETIVTSAGCGIRKPDGRIFRLALDKLGVEPGRSVMVGDTLDADVKGARQLGLFSIWINRRVENADPTATLPDLTVATLAEIPAALTRLSQA